VTEYRTGQGWDVHRIGPGLPMLLGGIPIAAEFGFEGHSDADVLAHAITDAILGAAALGDIGMHFPDTDPQWKGAGSLLFLKHAQKLAAADGFHVVNVDSTVILERPKLKDYRLPIREKLAEALSVPVGRISVKFKTAEKVGPVGEGRSAEAQAIVLLRRDSSPISRGDAESAEGAERGLPDE
jgi:2-C-methyl-D-erythritol 2,4-cyclodiphosphate synthase